jgi:DNA-binding transcriptional regulator YiaG
MRIVVSLKNPSRSRNWEQGRRLPEGPAMLLLRVAEKHPEAVLDAVRVI